MTERRTQSDAGEPGVVQAITPEADHKAAPAAVPRPTPRGERISRAKSPLRIPDDEIARPMTPADGTHAAPPSSPNGIPMPPPPMAVAMAEPIVPPPLWAEPPLAPLSPNALAQASLPRPPLQAIWDMAPLHANTEPAPPPDAMDVPQSEDVHISSQPPPGPIDALLSIDVEDPTNVSEPDGEEVTFDDVAPPHADPADATEVTTEDLVSIEAVPARQRRRKSTRMQSADKLEIATPATLRVPTPPLGAFISVPPPSTEQPPASAPTPIVAGPTSEASSAARRKARAWWEDFFREDFLRATPPLSDAQITREVDFIEESLGVAKGGSISDLGCGTGRHAAQLARRGYRVTGFDLSPTMLARAADELGRAVATVDFVQGDMRELAFEDTFDAVYCWNTSFGFFEEEKNAQVIQRIHKTLKSGGTFLLDVVNRDYLLTMQPSLAWFEGQGCICMDEMQIDWITSRMRVKRTIMMDDTQTHEVEYSIRIYSLHELGKVLHEHGFGVAEVSGRTATPGVFFGCDSPRVLILAEKK